MEELRQRFLTEAETRPERFHQADVLRVRNDDWQVRRFLQAYPNDKEQAYANLIKALEWKKAFKVHDLKVEMFPREFYECHGVEECGRTLDGCPLVWEILRTQWDFNGLNDHYCRFFAFYIEQLDQKYGETGYVGVTDATGAGLRNSPMDFVKFKIQTLEYYPGLLKRSYIVNMPWYLKPGMAIAFSLMSPRMKQLVQNVSETELARVIDPEHIPVALKGRRYTYTPPFNTPSIASREMMASLELDDERVNRYFQTLQRPRPQLSKTK